MTRKPKLASSLQSRVVALPESRQLDVLADLFERRQASVLRIPLVAILDAPDQAPVVAWIRQFIANPPDSFILLTGEGLRRLVAAAIREDLEEPFIEALRAPRKICRGPKPGRALKELGLKPDLLGAEPTTAGIIETLKTLDLAGSTMAVQLYGEDPNLLLIDYLASCNLRSYQTVAPYVYASNSDMSKVQDLILQLHQGKIDVIVFTSKSQIGRLFDVAKKAGLQSELRQGIGRTKVAAIGPIVRDELIEHNCEVHIMPESRYFMKPLVHAIELMYASESD